MASSECPKATTSIAALMLGQKVPSSQPSECSFIVRLAATGAGGNGAPPRSRSVRADQATSITTMTVVICMMRSAWPLDSWMPRVLLRQK